MTFDPCAIGCPHCGAAIELGHLCPDEYVDESAYVYTAWSCPGCGRAGAMDLRMAYVHARVMDEDGGVLAEVAE